MEIQITGGWTGDVLMQLLADGVAVNLTGTTVALVLRDRDGTLVDTSGDLTVTDPATGKVTWNPDAADLAVAKTPHRLRFKVTDAGSKIVYFPSGPAILVRVYAE